MREDCTDGMLVRTSGKGYQADSVADTLADLCALLSLVKSQWLG